VIGLLVNPKNPASQSETTDVQAAARALGLTIIVQNATSNRDIDAAFASFVQHRVDALTFAADSVFSKHHDQLIALADHCVGSISEHRGWRHRNGRVAAAFLLAVLVDGTPAAGAV